MSLKEQIRAKLERQKLAQKSLRKEVSQKAYDSMTSKQRTAQAYAAISATVGVYEEVLGLLEKQATQLLQKLMSEREVVYRKMDVDSPIGHVTKEFSAVSWEYIEECLKAVLVGVEETKK